MSPLHVVALEYVVAFYPLLLTIIVYICIQLHARDCQVIVCLCRVFCKCFSSCRQRWGRQWDPSASLVHTFAAFLLLSYSKILIISLQLLSYTQLYIFLLEEQLAHRRGCSMIHHWNGLVRNIFHLLFLPCSSFVSLCSYQHFFCCCIQ